MAVVTSNSDREAVRESGRIVRKVLTELAQFIRPGVTTAEIDALGREIIRGEGAIPSFLNYNGYPAAVCPAPFFSFALGSRKNGKRILVPVQLAGGKPVDHSLVAQVSQGRRAQEMA